MRALTAAAFFTVSLFAACPQNSSLCQEKFIDNAIVQNGTLTLPVTPDRNLVYSSRPLPESIKKDPFLGLYLIGAPAPNPYLYAVISKKPTSIAAVEAHTVIEGKIDKVQSGLNSLAQFGKRLIAPAVLSGPCCNLEGIVTARGIIEKEYIGHFLQGKESVYGDAGMRVVESPEGVAVASVDPFIPENPFKIGDIIERCNAKKAASAAAVMREILFSSPGETFDFVLRRNDQKHEVKVVMTRRYGGGLISDTFLERNGFYFDAGLTLTMASRSAAYAGLLRGDRLVRVNGKNVSSWKDVRDSAGGKEKEALLLFERDGFQFFIHLPYKK